MTDSPFRGVIPPVVIPLTEKRQLDLEALERSINRMIDAGVDGLFFLGSSGEVAFLTDAQRYHVLQEAIAMVHGRVPVLTGIIDMETMRVVDQAKRATGYGVDALVATAPFYALGGPKEVERHFRAIPRAHRPAAVCLRPARLRAHEARSHDARAPRRGRRAAGREGLFGRRRVVPLAVPAERGRPATAASADRPRGGRGSAPTWAVPTARFPGLANIDPASYVEQWRAAQAGELGRVREIQNHLARLMYVTREVKATVGFGAGVGAFKTALWQMGVFNTNQMREPVCALEGEDVEQIVAVLKRAGLMDADAPIRQAHWDACPVSPGAPACK